MCSNKKALLYPVPKQMIYKIFDCGAEGILVKRKPKLTLPFTLYCYSKDSNSVVGVCQVKSIEEIYTVPDCDLKVQPTWELAATGLTEAEAFNYLHWDDGFVLHISNVLNYSEPLPLDVFYQYCKKGNADDDCFGCRFAFVPVVGNPKVWCDRGLGYFTSVPPNGIYVDKLTKERLYSEIWGKKQTL